MSDYSEHLISMAGGDGDSMSWHITEEAVEAAAQALWQVHPLTRENVRAATRRALKVAAPHIVRRSDEDDQFYEQGRL